MSRDPRRERTIVTDDQLNHDFDTTEAPATGADAPQYGVGPFSIREVILGGVWLLAFVVSFFSLSTARFDSVWTSGLLWILTIGVPTVAVFLVALRRLSPEGIRRVGSLGIDQFASVAFTVSAVLWLQLIWETVAVVAQGGPWLRSWVVWVEFALMLAGVVLTVFAPIIPSLSDDFRGRPEVPAHRNARPVRAVAPRPARAPRATVAEDGPDGTAQDAGYGAGAYGAGAYDTGAYDSGVAATGAYDTGAFDTAAQGTAAHEAPAEATAEPAWQSELGLSSDRGESAADRSPRPQAFWALAPVERDVVDENGAPLFRIGPTAWALVIEDRGDVFVVRHEDGRVGYLHDVQGVTRG